MHGDNINADGQNLETGQYVENKINPSFSSLRKTHRIGGTRDLSPIILCK